MLKEKKMKNWKQKKKQKTKNGCNPKQTEIHTSNPDLTIPNTSESLVNREAKEPKDTPNMIAKEMPVNSPIWETYMTCYET